jgi:hypothetical protein
MAERLVILSDMWGIKKGLWVTSYLGYLQQFYDIVYYDCQELANVDFKIESEEELHNEFVSGGIEVAVANLLKKESNAIPSHYLAFSIGGTIAYKAGLSGLEIKSLYTVSATRLRKEIEKPSFETRFVYGSVDKFKPSDVWASNLGLELTIIDGYNHDMYSDEKITKEICQELLAKIAKKQLSA